MLQSTRLDLSRQQPIPISDSVIHVKNLSKKFEDQTIVKNMSFEVLRSTIFGFIGPSGSGKTTTIRMLTGVYKPTEGELTVLGANPARFNQKQRARLGYMPQLFVLYPNLNVWENLNFAASLYGMSLFREKKLRQTLEFVELYEHRWKLTRNISGGMQRRLSLAATLVHDPELLFLDEPTAGIDPVLRAKFWDRFRELQSQGRTLFITTQYVNEAENCDLVGVMSGGRLLVVDTPQGLRHHAYGGDIVEFQSGQVLSFEDEHLLRILPFVQPNTMRTGPDSMRIIVNDSSTAIPEIMKFMQERNIEVKSIEVSAPPFEDVFVELVRHQPEAGDE